MRFIFQDFLKDAIDKMAAKSLRCVAIAYRTYEIDQIPTDEEQLAQWTLPEDDLVLLAIVGIKVVDELTSEFSFFPISLNT